MYFLVLLILLLSGLVKSVVSSLPKFYTSNLHQNNALEYSLQWYWSTMDDRTFYIFVVVYIQLTLKKNKQLNFDHKSLVEIKIFIIWKKLQLLKIIFNNTLSFISLSKPSSRWIQQFEKKTRCIILLGEINR